MPDHLFYVEEILAPNHTSLIDVAKDSPAAAKRLVSILNERVGLSGIEADMFRLGCVAALCNNSVFYADFNNIHFQVRKAVPEGA